MSPSDLKADRHSAIRTLLAGTAIPNQDELRRKLARRGHRVTQATLSRDIRELHLMKGPNGYALPNGNGNTAEMEDEGADELPSLAELLQSFGLRVRQAQNQVVLITLMGSAQPVAAALDHANVPEIVGTIAGDNTILVICPDARQANTLCLRLRAMVD